MIPSCPDDARFVVCIGATHQSVVGCADTHHEFLFVVFLRIPSLQPILRMSCKEPLRLFDPRERDRQKLQCPSNLFIGLGATESQEPLALRTEAFAAEARHSESIVGPLHQEQGDICMGDGSVQQFSSSRLKQGFKDIGLDNNGSITFGVPGF